ncbi:MAG: two-component regulator propeller domain-containing protein, partial [Bacteroidales bacterium]|nr:two-component regulator propeller domain-containing protein [Bacteroidales bacterium]
PFSIIDKKDGLSSPKVYIVLQDRNDYIWIGTGSGLDRFDGKNIESVSIEVGIWHGGVTCILEDSEGLIWFGHKNGKISYYNGNNFNKIYFDSIEINGDITSLQELNGRIWFTTIGQGAFSAVYDNYSGDLKDYKQYKGAEGLSDQVTSSYITPGGQLFCLTDLRIKEYIPESNEFVLYKPEAISNHFTTYDMLEDSKGNRWFGTVGDGLIIVDSMELETTRYDTFDDLGSNTVTCLTEDSKGRIWAGTYEGGVTVFDGENITTYNKDNGLPALTIQSITEDHEGNILIASRAMGLFIFKGDHFVSYDSEWMFSNKNINAVNVDKHSRLWFGNNDGVTIYDPETRVSYVHSSEDKHLGNGIVAIQNDLNGNVWIATSMSGIYRYVSDNSYTAESKVNKLLNMRKPINSMVIDNENNIWIGTGDGLGIWNISLETGLRHTQRDGIAANDITSMFVDRDGYVWFGSQPSGLTRYNPASGKYKIIDLKDNLSISVITQTKDGTIWLGTTSGLWAFRNDSINEHITTRDGLLSNDIQLLQPDNRGSLYIGTNRGLNRYQLFIGKIVSYTEQNGFTGIEANQNASAISDDGHLWFGTVEGVTCLKPELIPETDQEPLTHIKGLKVHGIPRDMIQGMKLKYSERSLDIDYYSICLTNPDAVRYRVMFEGGAEPGWGQETDQTSHPYSSLSPGKYVFKVKAVNSNGIWNSEPETFAFTIKPPFYFSFPFIASMAILLIAGIWVYIRIREKNLIIEKQVLEEKVEERTAEVVEKSKVIEEKNRDITASIRYAERIQMAMLPPEDSFKDTFVLFLPKDIVSGDFYWMYDNGDVQFLAAVDCTGHGVPGAFMSIIGSNSLTKIVREYGIIQPAAILNQLNLEVTKSLIQRGETVINDGMDLALISYDKKTRKVEYAGAYNPLVIVRDGKHITIKADRFPIGMSQAGQKKFTNKLVDVESGDMLYMFSDGFADQFGGPHTKKFKSLNLKNEFLKISHLAVDDQKGHLINVLDDWRGEQSQIDDILIIGTRIQ